MQYRRMGRLDLHVSALGFGCMRLPVRGNWEEVDEGLTTDLLRHAIDQGVNYLDTAYGYHGGKSEMVIGRALENGYRERTYIATKLPHWLVRTREDLDRIFQEQLSRLRTERIDFYLLHNLQAERWPFLRQLGVLEWLEQLKARGEIGYIGFSFHETFPVFKGFLDSYDGWDFCQIQYNYANEEVQAGTRGLLYASGKGLGVVVMEPLLGGKLANPPARVREIMDASPFRRTPADWSLRWLWNRPEVSVVLSGMNAMEQLQENIGSACTSGVGSLSQGEMDLLERVKLEFASMIPIPCTGCGYCMPCPHGVDIPRNLENYNQGAIHDNFQFSKSLYMNVFSSRIRAGSCEGCGECEEKCPQRIEVASWMKRIHEELGGSAG